MKDNIVAKLAAQCEELYNEAFKQSNKESLKSLWDREWLSMVLYFSCHSIFIKSFCL